MLCLPILVLLLLVLSRGLLLALLLRLCAPQQENIWLEGIWGLAPERRCLRLFLLLLWVYGPTFGLRPCAPKLRSSEG
jgi:hypothetical protein